MRRSLFSAALVAGSFLVPAQANAVSPDLVISEVYGAGGNNGAVLQNDFVELFNRGATPVSLNGKSVQYASATGTGNFTVISPLSGELQPGQHALVSAGGGANGAPLPNPDFSGSTLMAAGAGKVALADQSGALPCNGGSDPCNPAETALIRDLVGYGNANFFEGTGPAPTASTTNSVHREGGGSTDTDNNSADFELAAPTPRNSVGDAPFLASSTPANNATGVRLGESIQVTFNEPVTIDPAGLALACSESGARAVTVGPGTTGTTFTVDPLQDLPRGETCTLTIAADAVRDVDADDPPDTMARASTTRFTTVGLLLRIHEIQGATHISPYDGRPVADVPGVVTALSGNGFWMQDTSADSDSETSEGIFVFTGSNPRTNPLVAVGAPLKVSGIVDEFRPGGSGGLGNLTTTEIVSPQIAAGTASGAVSATRIGTGPDAILPPDEIIENESGDVETPGFLFDPEQDGIDFHESLEGMLVSIEDPAVVGPTTSNEELAVLASGFGSPRTERGGVLIRPDDFNPERIILDDAVLLAQQPAGVMPPANVGDTLTGPVEAVVDYSFGNPKYLVTGVPEVNDNGLQPEVTEEPRANQLAMASMNVENLAANDPTLSPAALEAKFGRLAGQLVNSLRSPDIVAVEEIQDANGTTNNGVVDAGPTYARFIDAIVAAGGPRYEYRQIDPVNNADGGAPGGNIRVGFLFRTDRGVEFVDRPGGTATNQTGVEPTRKGARLTFSPGRLQDPDDASTFQASRKPLAGEFEWRGRRVFAIANHFNSKGGDDPLFGHRQPPVAITEVQRHQQAAVLAGFVEDVLAADPRAAVAVLGDLNDFDFSETLDIVERAGLNNLMDTLPPNERYSYVFDGNSQVLDQILVSDELMTPGPEYDSVHVNAEFADQASDHDPQVARVVVRGTGNASGE
jgi:uncharacterized protein